MRRSSTNPCRRCAASTIRACVPSNQLGTLNLKSLKVVDTYAGDATNIGAAVVVNEAAGGTVNAAAHTITWDLPSLTVTSCASTEPDVNFVRTVTLTYPDSMIPVAVRSVSSTSPTSICSKGTQYRHTRVTS